MRPSNNHNDGHQHTTQNHRMMFVFGGGALMSYVGASAAGKNNRYKMEDVYERGKLDTLKLYEKMNEEKKEAAKQDLK